uniref:Uncharacterized protein n=1 Tax=Arundo donax TaxID=35708 RepID=A0A0A9B5D0_ARUDO
MWRQTRGTSSRSIDLGQIIHKEIWWKHRSQRPSTHTVAAAAMGSSKSRERRTCIFIHPTNQAASIACHGYIFSIDPVNLGWQHKMLRNNPMN